MSQHRKSMQGHPSWTALPEDDAPPSPTVSSEDEILESSQEMRDELLSSPEPGPSARKRKPDIAQSPARPSAVNANKRRRLDKNTPQAGSSSTRRRADDDDLPASAHAKPAKRPPPSSSSVKRNSLPSGVLVSRMNAFQQSRGTVSRRTSNVVNSKETLGTLSKFADRNVARKTTKPPSLRRYVDPGSISQLRPKPAAQDRERRNTLPAKPTEEIDLTMDDDDDVAPSAIHKPWSFAKTIAPLRAPSKQYEALGKEDDPIVLSDSDDEVAPQTARIDSGSTLWSSQPRSNQLENRPGRNESNYADFNVETPRRDSPPSLTEATQYAAVPNSPSTIARATARDSQSPDLGTIVPALGDMEISCMEDQPEPKDPPSSTPSMKSATVLPVSPTFGLFSRGETSSSGRPAANSLGLSSQTPVSPSRRIHTHLSGKGGFFKAVYERRASGGCIASQASPSGYTLQSTSAYVESPTSSLNDERISDGYASSSATGHELPPSSEVSRVGSTEPTLRPASVTSLPVAETEKLAIPERPASQGPGPTYLPRSGNSNSALKTVITTAQFQVAQKENNFIDLTMSDSEEEIQPTTWSDPEDVASTTHLLASIAPGMFDEVSEPPLPAIAAPKPRTAAPTLDMIKAAHRNKQIKMSSPIGQQTSPRSSSGSDSFPVARRVSIDIPALRSQSLIHTSSSEENLAHRKDSSHSVSTPTSDNSDKAPKALHGPRQSRSHHIESPPASGNEFENDEDQASGSEMEIRDLLLSDKNSETTGSSGSPVPDRRYPQRERKIVQRHVQPVATRRSSSSSDVPIAGPSRRGSNKRGRATRSEEALVPAIGNITIWSDEDDEDDDTVLTWNNHGRNIIEYADVDLRARDLPFNLQDRMMSLPLNFLRADDMQLQTFKSEISVGTSVDEPNAPEIHIINDVDDELCPPFEFHYTNQMYHGDGVPKPDVAHLQHCNCVPYCKPETCPCAKRQMQWIWVSEWKRGQPPPDPAGGFLYDKNGRLLPEYHDNQPIFECNAKCRCDDDQCQNRVVQKGRKVAINIKKTPNKGWGVFAGQAIPAHTFIGIYAGEILTDAEGGVRGEKYDEFGRTYLFNIDGHHIKKWAQYNGRKNWKITYCIDAYHAGNFTRYLNHSCDPNCSIVPCYINEANVEKPLLTIWTVRDVVKDEEICFSYFGEPDESDFKPMSRKERKKLTNIHALCQCGAARCTGRMWKFSAEEEGSSDDE